MSGQWEAEWYVTCAGECGRRFWIDGRYATERYRNLRGDGWVQGADGWVCPECVAAFAYAPPPRMERPMNDLKAFAARVIAGGPARVVVNTNGEAVSCRRAREEHHLTPDVVFIRKDGWTLGAPNALAAVAEKLWRGEWLGVLVRPASEPVPYAEWVRSRGEPL